MSKAKAMASVIGDPPGQDLVLEDTSLHLYQLRLDAMRQPPTSCSVLSMLLLRDWMMSRMHRLYSI